MIGSLTAYSIVSSGRIDGVANLPPDKTDPPAPIFETELEYFGYRFL
jgi:hypothetical protein